MIQLNTLSKRFDDIEALNGISTTISDGSIFGLIGSNGSGKSTLLRLITGIYRPDSGNVSIDDKPVFENPAAKERFFFVSDDPYIPAGANMLDLISFYEDFYPHFDRARCLEMAEAFNLDPRRRLSAYSKGMLRQANILLGVAANTDYLIMDETFDGLDPVKRQAVKRLLGSLIVDGKRSVIIASHNLRELEDICDHIAFLHNGQIVLDRDTEDLSDTSFKVQCAFADEKTAADFAFINPQHVDMRGRMAQLIVRGDRDKISEKLQSLNPLYLEILPLTLEEIFISEMEVLGYEVDRLTL